MSNVVCRLVGHEPHDEANTVDACTRCEEAFDVEQDRDRTATHFARGLTVWVVLGGLWAVHRLIWPALFG